MSRRLSRLCSSARARGLVDRHALSRPPRRRRAGRRVHSESRGCKVARALWGVSEVHGCPRGEPRSVRSVARARPADRDRKGRSSRSPVGTCAAHARAGSMRQRSRRYDRRASRVAARVLCPNPLPHADRARPRKLGSTQKATRNPTWRGKWMPFPKDVPRVSSSALPRASTRDAARPEALIRTLRITKDSYVTMCLRGNGNDTSPRVIARVPYARPPSSPSPRVDALQRARLTLRLLRRLEDERLRALRDVVVRGLFDRRPFVPLERIGFERERPPSVRKCS